MVVRDLEREVLAEVLSEAHFKSSIVCKNITQRCVASHLAFATGISPQGIAESNLTIYALLISREAQNIVLVEVPVCAYLKIGGAFVVEVGITCGGSLVVFVQPFGIVDLAVVVEVFGRRNAAPFIGVEVPEPGHLMKDTVGKSNDGTGCNGVRNAQARTPGGFGRYRGARHKFALSRPRVGHGCSAPGIIGKWGIKIAIVVVPVVADTQVDDDAFKFHFVLEVEGGLYGVNGFAHFVGHARELIARFARLRPVDLVPPVGVTRQINAGFDKVVLVDLAGIIEFEIEACAMVVDPDGDPSGANGEYPVLIFSERFRNAAAKLAGDTGHIGRVCSVAVIG